MSDPLEFVAPYISPLTEKQHAAIGRIAILWGQIEFEVETLLVLVTGLTWEELSTLGVTDKPIGAKVPFLKAASKRLENELGPRVRAFCGEIDKTKLARNNLFHGIWGWRGDKRTKRVYPAARKSTNPSNPFKATQLPGLEKQLCKCSRLGSDIVMDARGQHPARQKYAKFMHGGAAEFPEWFRQWSVRNPVDHELLDRTSKAGRLPHLDAPLSER